MKTHKILCNVTFISGLLVLAVAACGCAKADTLEEAEKNVKQSQSYYSNAVNTYKTLISQNKQLDRVRFELGKLYYTHGDFAAAIEELKATNYSQAKKLLGISLYFLGDYTDALEVFGKYNNLDDESRYYYGLTCEKLNLFDLALDNYNKIKEEKLLALALNRKDSIQKKAKGILIKDIDPQAAKIIAEAPDAQKYPQAGALILYSDEKVEITDLNQEISTSRYLVKILNDRGKQDFSEAQIEYDSTFEKIEIIYARVIKPDGSVVDVGSRHIRDVSKYLNFPLYSNARIKIISFPEISENAVIEYKFRVLRNKMVNDKDFVSGYPLQSNEPIIKADFTIDAPVGLPLHINFINEKYNNFGAELKPKIEKTDNRLIYRWKFSDIPQIIPEVSMPSNVEVNPSMLYSTFASWKDVYNWWWKLAKDKIIADTDIKNKVVELTANLKSEEEKIRAIYNFCAKEIRYVAVEYGQAGHEPHKAEDIFRNKYGDCKDQAVLLVTMLKEAGLEGYLVLIPTKNCYNLNPDFASILFDHCIAAVKFQDKLVFLDPTAETCSFGDLPGADQGRKVLVFSSSGYQIEETPLFEAKHNQLKQSIEIKLNPDESILAKREVAAYGFYDQGQRYWLLYTPPQLIEETLKERIQDSAVGAKLINYHIRNLNDLNTPVVLDYEFSGNDYLTSAGKLRILPQLASIENSFIAKDSRAYPLDFVILNDKEIQYSIDIGESFIVKYLPQNISEDSPWFKFELGYKIQGKKIIFTQKSELKNKIVLEKDYQEFKKFFQNLAKKVKQRIVLEKIK